MTDKQSPEGAATEGRETPTQADTEGKGPRFTQDDVDRIVKERLAREAAKHADYEELKGKAAQWEKHEEAQKSELEKAQEKIAALERASTAQAAAAKETVVRYAAEAIAAALGFQNPTDAYLLADLANVSVEPDGNIKGLKEAIEALAQTHPYLVAKGKPSPPNLDAGQGQPPERGGTSLTSGEQAAIAAAQRLGYKIDPEAVRKNKSKSRARFVMGAPAREEE